MTHFKMVALAVEIWLALMVACYAAPFPVNDDEQRNIAYICELAAKSPLVNIEQTAGIAQFCVAWKAKIAAAAEKKPEEEGK